MEQNKNNALRVRVENEVREKIEAIAAKKKLTLSEALREAISAYIRNN